MDRRRTLRKDLKIPIKYQLQHVVHGVLTHDVSSGGLSFVANHFMAKSKMFPITLALDFLDVPMQVMSKVAWVASMPFGEQYRIGLEFQDMSPFHCKQIGSYVDQV